VRNRRRLAIVLGAVESAVTSHVSTPERAIPAHSVELCGRKAASRPISGPRT
jgi:hypothetical protein